MNCYKDHSSNPLSIYSKFTTAFIQGAVVFQRGIFFFFSLIRWFDSVGRDIWLGRSLLELKLQQRKWCLIIMEVWCHLVWLLYFTHDSSPQDMWPVGFYNICSLKGTRIFDLNKIRWRLIYSVFWMSHIHITVSQTFTHLKRKWDWVLGLFKKHFSFQGSRKYIHILRQTALQYSFGLFLFAVFVCCCKIWHLRFFTSVTSENASSNLYGKM